MPTLTEIFAAEWTRLVAIPVRDFRDLDIAEDAAQDAFVEATARWSHEDFPIPPGAWLLTTARRKAIDRIRRAQRLDALLPLVSIDAADRASGTSGKVAHHDDALDEQLALLIGCCHPALSMEAQVALTLLIDARRVARVDADGVLVVLAEQDRSRRDRQRIGRGLACLARAHAAGQGGLYQLQAAVAARHATATSVESTHWCSIVRLYDAMLRVPQPLCSHSTGLSPSRRRVETRPGSARSNRFTMPMTFRVTCRTIRTFTAFAASCCTDSVSLKVQPTHCGRPRRCRPTTQNGVTSSGDLPRSEASNLT